ncbi:MAG: ABC transporter substrate-binding protein [Betaproteobacteria bacterium]|nr:ABC transporter substrate-binding protein [Betaproteobacteria bacterium]
MIAPVRAALLGLGLWLLGATAWSQGVTPRTIVLGQSAPLSGPLQSAGEDVRNGALAYFRRLNDAGGVHGRRIELATLDDAGDAERTLANTTRFVEEFKVFALFGYADAGMTRELLALLQKAGVPLFGPVTGAALARQPERSVFTVRAGRADEIESVISHYAQLRLKRFALLRADDPAGAEFLAAARSALALRGLAAPVDAALKQASDGVAGLVREIFVADPDVVVIALPQPPAADLVRALRRAGRGTQIVALSPADPERLAEALGRDGAGVTLSQVLPPLARVSLPVVAAYRAAIEAETGRNAYAPASFEAYIAASVFAEAVRRVGPALTRNALLRALEAMSYHDAGGHIVGFSRTNRQGSARTYLMALTRDGTLLH